MPVPGAGPWNPDDEPPLPARSVVASTLLGVRPAVLPTGLLVRSCGLFGISAGTARVAMSRMVRTGELTVDDGHHALAGPLLERLRRQDLSTGAVTRDWDPEAGTWLMLVVTAPRRSPAQRADSRRVLTTRRLAERREGLWTRPDNLTDDPGHDPAVTDQGEIWWGRPDHDPATLAAHLWDLDGWARRAYHLESALAASRPALEADDRTALRPGFVLSAAVLRHLQSDPLLPPALLPTDWPGSGLRRAHQDWRRAFEHTWAEWARRPPGSVAQPE